MYPSVTQPRRWAIASTAFFVRLSICFPQQPLVSNFMKFQSVLHGGGGQQHSTRLHCPDKDLLLNHVQFCVAVPFTTFAWGPRRSHLESGGYPLAFKGAAPLEPLNSDVRRRLPAQSFILMPEHAVANSRHNFEPACCYRMIFHIISLLVSRPTHMGTHCVVSSWPTPKHEGRQTTLAVAYLIIRDHSQNFTKITYVL